MIRHGPMFVLERSVMRRTFCVLLAVGCGDEGVRQGMDAGADGRVDAAPTNDTDGPPPAGKVAMFVAQGSLGRTMVSCDDGNTWVGNHSWEMDGDAFLCGMVQPDVRCGDPCTYSQYGTCVQRPCCADVGDM